MALGDAEVGDLLAERPDALRLSRVHRPERHAAGLLRVGRHEAFRNEVFVGLK